MTNGKKYCPKCKTVKPIEEFGKNQARYDGVNSYCIICNNQYSLGRYRAKKFKKICPICKKEFEGLKNQTYCSHKCRGSINKKPITGYKKCLYCGKEFPYRKSLKTRGANGVGCIKQKFCSLQCSLRYNNTNPKIRKKQALSLKKFYKTNSSALKGIKLSKERRMIGRLNNLGSKSHFWKGGITNINRKIRMGLEFRLWREAVFARDDYTCQKCKERGGKLRPHHILNFSTNAKKRFDIKNGITLCDKCHKSFHQIYGVKNNTRKQLQEFIRLPI